MYFTIHNLVKLTPSVSPTASHLPQRGRQYPAPSLRELSAKLTEGVLKLWIVDCILLYFCRISQPPPIQQRSGKERSGGEQKECHQYDSLYVEHPAPWLVIKPGGGDIAVGVIGMCFRFADSTAAARTESVSRSESGSAVHTEMRYLFFGSGYATHRAELIIGAKQCAAVFAGHRESLLCMRMFCYVSIAYHIFMTNAIFFIGFADCLCDGSYGSVPSLCEKSTGCIN